MISSVNLAIAALVMLLAIIAVGIVFGSWLRSLMVTTGTVNLSPNGRDRRKRPTIDRGNSAVKAPPVGRTRL